MSHELHNNSACESKAALGVIAILVASLAGSGCNSQKADKAQKPASHSASGAEENRRQDLANQNNNNTNRNQSDKADEDDDKDEKRSRSRSQGNTGSDRRNTNQTNLSDRDIDTIISRLGLTRSEVEALQRVGCSRSSEEWAQLASRFGFGDRGGSSGRNGFNLNQSGSYNFSQSDLDALRDLARSGRNISPDTILRAQEALCKNSSGSSSSRNRSSRDDDDDDKN
jgi:hypothetical protein